MAEEINDRYETKGDAKIQELSDRTSDSHNTILSDYNNYKYKFDNKLKEDFNIIDKVSSAVARDYGLGNVQGFKAIELLESYIANNPNSDPLNIKSYKNNYNALINDLSNFSKDTNAKFVVLATVDAYDWGKKNVSNWNNLAQSEKEGLSVFIYNMGIPKMEDYKKKGTVNGQYNVKIDRPSNVKDTPIAIEYLINEVHLKKIIDPNYTGQFRVYSNGNLKNVKNSSSSPCFSSSTPILTPKGEALIQDIQVGDAVMAFDGFGELLPSRVVNLQRKTTDTWIELSFDNKTIKATPNHRMFTPSGDFATLSEMIEQAQNNHLQLVDAQGKTVDVAFTVITLDVPEDTYNFEVETLHTYVAGGLRVHNDCIHLLPNEKLMSSLARDQYYFELSYALKDAKANGYKITAFKADGEFNNTEYNLLGESGLADNGFGSIKTVDANGVLRHFVSQNNLQSLATTSEDVKHNVENFKINGKKYALLSETAKVVIDGVDYTAGAIVEAGEIAYDALSDFIKGNYKNNIISNALSNALNNTFADIAGIIASGGTVDGTKILQTFAKRSGYAFIASSFTQTAAVRELTVYLNGGKTVNINNTTYIELKDGRNIAINADLKTESDGNVFYEGKNSSGQTVKISEAELSLGGTGKAAISGLLNFGIQAAFEGKNWNSSDYIENGTITVGTAVASQLIQDNFSDTLGKEWGAAGVAAAATTIIAGVIRNPNMNAGEYAMLGVQAGVAAGSTIGGIAVANYFGTASYSALYGALAINPLALAVGVVISVALNSVLAKAIGSTHLNPGETQTLNAAEDQLWKFAKLGVKETDSNGVEKTVLKDAIYVTNADGVMLNKQAMLDSRSMFRVFNGTVATNTAKANFQPTYLLGGKAADNIIGNGDSEVIYGYDGSDFLDGRGGNNSIFAGGGNDVILAASGRDFIDAGEGDDFVEVEGGNNVIILGKGDDKLYAGGGNDVINAGEGSDVIQAGHGDNIIILGNPTLADDGAIISDTDISRNEVYAGYGRDNITGSSGRDIIVGDYLDNKGVSDLNTLGDAQVRALGYMNDTIRAGDGGDLVMGGLGQDTIYGGKGNDVLIGGSDLMDYSLLKFVPSDVDFIYGEAGDDRLKLKTQGANDNSKKHKLQNVA